MEDVLSGRFDELLKGGPDEERELHELLSLAAESGESLGVTSAPKDDDLGNVGSQAIDDLFQRSKCPARAKVVDAATPCGSGEEKAALTPGVIRGIFRSVPPPPKPLPSSSPPPGCIRSERKDSGKRSIHPAFSQQPEEAAHAVLSQQPRILSLSPEQRESRRRPQPQHRRLASGGTKRTQEVVNVDDERPTAPKSAFRTAQAAYKQEKRARGTKRNERNDDDYNRTPSKHGRTGGRNSIADASVRAIGRAVHRGRTAAGGGGSSGARRNETTRDKDESDIPEIPNVDARMVEMIMNEMLDKSPGVDWADIAGLHFAKRCVMEAVVYPMLRPDIFSGLRSPPRGLLLFGPPGTGKTLIGRAIASRSGASFFNISASSLMSKWIGEGEKMVRALFAVARHFQPAVVFVDEIDSLLTARSDGEQEASRRVKTEFLVQMDGAGTDRTDRVLLVGATNRPHELDEAARRRLVKRLYIPLPDDEARRSMVERLLTKSKSQCTDEDYTEIVNLSKGYSGSDIYALCAEAALVPVRELGEAIGDIDESGVRPIGKNDFVVASKAVRASVSSKDLDAYIKWNSTFGSFPMDANT